MSVAAPGPAAPDSAAPGLVPGDELLFLALGGAGEIGMNLNLYGTQGRWLMVDLGVTFGDETTPGIDVVLPDPGFIAAQPERLAGLVLTHAHEDHIGAVSHLWPRLRCPIYATPFTARLLRGKLEEAGLLDEAVITEVPLSGRFEVGPFALELITLTHSIPEPNAVVIRTPFGAVLHTGDWKFDPDPLVGEVSDEAALHRLGEAGVLAMICDSTNVLRAGDSGSESALRDSLMELVGRFRGRVAVTCFASNVARIETLATVAAAHGRQPVLVGRALWRMVEVARATGYLAGICPLLNEREGAGLAPAQTLLICTGSQGEPRAALARIASGEHAQLRLEAGDTVIFSSRMIPGNERAIGRLINAFVRKGVEVVTEGDHFIHVSGHPARDELTRMFQMVRPQIAVPVHGEDRHMMAQARLARECQVPEAVVIRNGDILRLAPGPAQVVATAPVGRLMADGSRLLEAEAEVLRTRRRMAFNGVAVASLVLDSTGLLAAPPQLSAPGLLDPEADAAILDTLRAAVCAAVEGLSARDRANDGTLREAVRLAVRRGLNGTLGRRPVTHVHLLRV